ncbi:hypothetical protein AVEN_85385-1, partial [Araneus ventricosus]
QAPRGHDAVAEPSARGCRAAARGSRTVHEDICGCGSATVRAMSCRDRNGGFVIAARLCTGNRVKAADFGTAGHDEMTWVRS